MHFAESLLLQLCQSPALDLCDSSRHNVIERLSHNATASQLQYPEGIICQTSVLNDIAPRLSACGHARRMLLEKENMQSPVHELTMKNNSRDKQRQNPESAIEVSQARM